ncbi:hypothetical protein [Nonomuraea fuscirosea]|uniref:hypothetical protein n=1 Tax=Nonomuraea fuscirosea TaxID=1291556 RepID=UPI0033CA1414
MTQPSGLPPKPFARMAGLLAWALISIAACQQDKPPTVDIPPLPSAANPPYLCNHIPEAAARLMTGVRDPIVVGTLTKPRAEPGHGTCGLYQPTGERVQLLRVTLDTGGIRGQIDEYVKDGGRLLPAIMHDGYGAYIKDPEQQTHIAAILVRGKARLLVDLGQGSTGRDNAGDMVAFMKLIAPKLLADTGAPSLSPSQKTGS